MYFYGKRSLKHFFLVAHLGKLKDQRPTYSVGVYFSIEKELSVLKKIKFFKKGKNNEDV